MPYNGSGVFTLVAGNPVVTGTVISSTWANNTLADIANNGLTNALTKDGQQTPTGNIQLAGFRLTGLGDAVNLQDAVTAKQIQNGPLTTLASVSGTDTITATTSPGITAYVAGQCFDFIAAGNNATTSVTLNINALGAKNVTKFGANALNIGDLLNGVSYRVRYDGTQFEVISPIANPALSAISGSVATSALTLNYTPSGPLQFRSGTLGSGAINIANNVAPLSITVPSAATLGTVSGVQATLVLLVAYNAGTPVLCVANASGGISFDETGLISPTTISAGSGSASIIYSASAVAAGSPYRVVGVFQITEATAGNWNANPSLIQPIGGQAFTALQSFGFGQTLQGLVGSRALSTTYYNTTNRPIAVYVQIGGVSQVNAALNAVVNGFNFFTGPGAPVAGGATCIQFIVPAGASYSVGNQVGSGTLSIWNEQR